MNKKYDKKSVLFSLSIILLTVVLFFFSLTYQYKSYVKEYNSKINSIVNEVLSKYPEISDICREDFIYTCLFQALRTKNILDKDKIKLYIPQIKSYVKKYKPSKKYFKSLPIKKKIRLISISNCFGLVCNLQNALNIGNKSNIG